MTAEITPFQFALAMQGITADRPSASTVPPETLYWSTDDSELSVSDGSAWNTLTGGGGGGVTSIDGGGGPLTGDVTLSEGTGVTLTQVGQNIEIAASAASLDQQGSGSPVGTVTPTAIGYRYTDTDTGGLYVAVGATSADWIAVSGPADPTVAGVSVAPGDVEIAAAAGDESLVRIQVLGTVGQILHHATGGTIITLPAGGAFQLLDSTGNPMLSMTEGSPDLHIKTGGVLVANL